MITIGARMVGGSISSVLCLGAHCDDIEIGCGGTLLRLCDENPRMSVVWVIFSSDEQRRHEARESATRFLQRAAKSEVVLKDFTERYFPYVAGSIKDYFDRLGRELSPEVVFTHYRDDRHQDHRTIADLTWNTFRDHLILEYEVPKYDGDLGVPNVFVDLNSQTCRRKIEVITESFRSQEGKHWFSEETLWAILRLRGIECRASSGHAEAFYGRKLLLM